MPSNLAIKLNWYRQSELEGSLMLGRLVSRVADPHLIARLTKHCAEEAEHSQIWAETIQTLGLPMIKIRRSYQSFYLNHGGVPASVLEVLSFTQIFERRVHCRFSAEARKPETPEPVRRAYRKMIEDEKDHLGWVAEWLRRQPGASQCLRYYQEIDERVFQEIHPFEDRLWDAPGLCDVTFEPEPLTP
jgi:hypothetical protein